MERSRILRARARGNSLVGRNWPSCSIGVLKRTRGQRKSWMLVVRVRCSRLLGNESRVRL